MSSQCTSCWALPGTHQRWCTSPDAVLRGHGVGMKAQKTRTKTDRGDTSRLPSIAYKLANGACLARHIHHRDCPQHVDNASWSEFVAHHRDVNGDRDDPLFLLWVWNGAAGKLGAGGCHGQIHTHTRLARVLGHVRFTADDHLFGIGVPRALELGEITTNQLTEAGYTP